MSYDFFIKLTCDGCGAMVESNVRKLDTMRRLASRDFGWGRKHFGKTRDLCRSCLAVANSGKLNEALSKLIQEGRD